MKRDKKTFDERMCGCSENGSCERPGLAAIHIIAVFRDADPHNRGLWRHIPRNPGRTGCGNGHNAGGHSLLWLGHHIFAVCPSSAR